MRITRCKCGGYRLYILKIIKKHSNTGYIDIACILYSDFTNIIMPKHFSASLKCFEWNVTISLLSFIISHFFCFVKSFLKFYFYISYYNCSRKKIYFTSRYKCYKVLIYIQFLFILYKAFRDSPEHFILFGW